MVSIKFLYNIDSLHVICYTFLVAVTWLSGLLSLDTTHQAKLFWVDNTVSGSKEEGRVEIVMLFVFESFHAILLRYQPSVGLAHLCFRLSSLVRRVESVCYRVSLKITGINRIYYCIMIINVFYKC